MATVTSKTSIKIDDLINDQVISGEINSNGQLLLTTRGGDVINAGSVLDPGIASSFRWQRTVTYKVNSIVGYAGRLWKALTQNLNKAPALYSADWFCINASDVNAWADIDPLFVGSSVTDAYQLFWTTGTVTRSLTSTAGEFETGLQALKISLGAASSQRIYSYVENIVKGGEVVTATVRAKGLAAGTNVRAILVQSDTNGAPEPFESGVVQTESAEGTVSVGTSWTTYTFTMTALNAKPRALVHFIFTNPSGGAVSVVVDSLKIARANPQALAAWPVGSIFFSASPTNPALLLGGGTWVAWGAGRVPVGVDGSQTEFDTVEETGGSKTNTHNHWTAHGGDNTIHYTTATAHMPRSRTTGGTKTYQQWTTTTPAVSNSRETSTYDETINILQPYITCYMWKRTA